MNTELVLATYTNESQVISDVLFDSTFLTSRYLEKIQQYMEKTYMKLSVIYVENGITILEFCYDLPKDKTKI